MTKLLNHKRNKCLCNYSARIKRAQKSSSCFL